MEPVGGAAMADDRSKKKLPFANTDEFYTALGRFFAAWSRTELAIDCAMWKARGTETEEQAHERSARIRFSDKCKQFRKLLNRSKFERAEKVRDLLKQIEHNSGRNVFAHSFWRRTNIRYGSSIVR
jgi:DNA-binding transcriptional regulator GbsR (MarR family)